MCTHFTDDKAEGAKQLAYIVKITQLAHSRANTMPGSLSLEPVCFTLHCLPLNILWPSHHDNMEENILQKKMFDVIFMVKMNIYTWILN